MIVGNGAPTKNTPGILGQEYFDKTSSTTYICVNAKHVTGKRAGESDNIYEWKIEGGAPFSDSRKDVVVLPETTFSSVLDEEYGDEYAYGVIECDLSLTVGKSYKVIFLGQLAYELESFMCDSGVCLGAYGNDFSTCPFRISNYLFDDGRTGIHITTVYPGTGTISIILHDGEVTTIDAKYLPEDMRFGDFREKRIIIPEVNIYNPDYTSTNTFLSETLLVAGENYTVVLDGVEYNTTANVGEYDNILLGTSLYDYSEFPFGIECFEYEDDEGIIHYVYNVGLDGEGMRTFSLFQVTGGEVVPINPKYASNIPMVVRTVELSTYAYDPQGQCSTDKPYDEIRSAVLGGTFVTLIHDNAVYYPCRIEDGLIGFGSFYRDEIVLESDGSVHIPEGK